MFYVDFHPAPSPCPLIKKNSMLQHLACRLLPTIHARNGGGQGDMPRFYSSYSSCCPCGPSEIITHVFPQSALQDPHTLFYTIMHSVLLVSIIILLLFIQTQPCHLNPILSNSTL